jgi:Flp pilus assembly protein TadD
LRAAKDHPDRPRVLRDLAYCLLKLDDVDGAIATYERAIALNDGDWEAYRGLGVAYMVKAQRTGDESLRAGAVHHWRRSLAINPDQPKRDWLEKLIKEHSTTMDPLRGSND